MAVNERLRIQQITLDGVSWTEILAPFDCNGFTIEDQGLATDIKLRSDKDDMTTEVTCVAGTQRKVITNPPFTSAGDSSVVNFKKDMRILYAQSASGTITAVTTYL